MLTYNLLLIPLIIIPLGFYMHYRLKKGFTQQAEGNYKPNLLLSIVELVSILVVFSFFSYLFLYDNYGVVGVILFSFVAFVGSFFLVNKKTYETFGVALPYIFSTVYILFFISGTL